MSVNIDLWCDQLDQAGIGFGLIDRSSHRISACNRQFGALTCQSAESLRTAALEDMIARQDRQLMIDQLEQLAERQLATIQLSQRFNGSDGHSVFVHISIVRSPDFGEQLWPVFIQGRSGSSSSDLIARRNAATSQAILRALPDTMFRLAQDGTHLDFFSHGTSALFVDPEHIIGHTVDELLPSDAAAAYLEHIPKALNDDAVQVFQYDLNRSENEVRHYEARMVACSAQEVLVIVQDITQRKYADEELQNVERLRSLGILASGIAHDFNNLLTGIYSSHSLIEQAVANNQDPSTYLEATEQSLKRAQQLSNQLLTFAKGGEPIKHNAQLTDLIRAVVTFDLTGSHTRAQFELAPNAWPVAVDVGQIQQVFSNLTINSAQAMPSGGLLTVRLKNTELKLDHPLGLQPGRYVRIEFSDQGPGIDPDLLDKIFDPFFSTKSSGSGLGLATAFSIVNKHGGHLGVDPDGPGTTFYLYLPATKQTDTERRKISASKQPTSLAGKRILVMDDEEVIRLVVSQILKHHGCDVECAEHGDAAIASYHQAIAENRPFDLCLLDLTIPGGKGGKGGKETVLAIREHDPQAIVIATSGYNEHAANYQTLGFHGFLLKPFAAKQLTSTLNKAFA